jgi:hypothetical protein
MNTMTDRDTHRVIPLMDVRPRSLAVPAAAFDAGTRASADGLLTDTRGRPLRDLRISHRPLQLSLQLLHAERNFWHRLPLSQTRRIAEF